MSVSNKSTKLTERQAAEQKEAKKLKIYTILFAVVLVALVVVAICVGVSRNIASSGVNEKKTVAATIGEHQISSAELNFFYRDAVNDFNNNYGSYAFLYGIDTSKPLDQQVADEETGETWADTFISNAVDTAKAVYAMVDQAKAEGFTLTEEQKASIETLGNNIDAYAKLNNVSDADTYIRYIYGNGSTKAGYLSYYENRVLASSYQAAKKTQMGDAITAEQIAAEDAENAANYTSYNFNQYYLATNKFLTGGTTDEEGNTTYTAEEKAAAAEAAEAACKELVNAKTAEELDAAIAALEVNKDTTAASTAQTNTMKSSINSYLADWVTDSSRTAGDIQYFPVTSTTTDENGNETTSVNAYYVALYNGANDNNTAMINVRHILVSFDGEANEDGTYSEEIKAAAKASAEEILNQWKSGDATEESFAALANEKSTDGGSNTNGGLYENVYPGQMVANFNDWCFDSSRKSGDTDIVETNYGYHIMYFVSTSDVTYRTQMIKDTLLNNQMNTWYEETVATVSSEIGDTQYINKSIVMNSSN